MNRNAIILRDLVVMIVAVCAIGLLAPSSYAAPPEQMITTIDGFLAAVRQNDQLNDEQRNKIVSTVEALRDDEYDREVAITEGLCELYPKFRDALDLLGQEELGPAINSLQQMASSDDPYLAADASFFLARSYMLRERYEEALPLLADVTGKWADKSVQTGNAQFLLGVSQARLLQRQEAIATLTKYIDENPNAPERMKIGAWRQLQQLQLIEDGTLTDVFERMDYSRRHLQIEKTGERTQEEQDKIVSVLAKLIKEAEERECNCSGGGQGEGQQSQGGGGDDGEGEGQTQGQGGSSKNPNGKVTRVYRRGPESPWSKLRDRERDPAFSAIKEQLPARYQQLIEQYYKSFQEGGE